MQKGWVFTLLLLIFTGATLIRVWEINRIGSVGDEWDRYRAGVQYVSAISKLDFKGQAWGWNIEHPPIAKYIYGVAGKLTIRFLGNNPDYPHDNNFTLARFFSAVIQSLTVVLVFLVGREFFSTRIGLFAAGILATIPIFVAYGRIVSLESPLVFFYTFSVWLFLKGIKYGKNNYFLFSAILAGFAIATRYDAVLLLVLFFLLFFIFNFKEFKSGLVKVPSVLIFFPIIALATFFISWPYLWWSPFKNFMQSIGHWGTSGGGESRFYYLNYFLVTTPAFLFVPLVTSFIRLLVKKEKLLFAVFIWFLTPFVLSLASIEQGGLRYVLPIFPPLSILLALGVDYISPKKLVFGLIGIVTVLYLLFWDFKVHPYYLDYFNEVVGGTKGAAGRGYSYGYWSEGIAEAVSYVNKTLPKGASLQLAITAYHALPPLRPDIVLFPKIISRNQLGMVKPEEIGKGYFVESFMEDKKADFLLVHEIAIPGLERYYKEIYSLNVLGAPLYELYKKL